jgi:hypothetical protein
MNPTTARLARLATHAGVAAVAQLVLATATASAGPSTAAPCGPAGTTRPAERKPAPPKPAHPHVDTPVRHGDLCTQDGATGYAQPGTRAVTCGHYRGLNHLTWG